MASAGKASQGYGEQCNDDSENNPLAGQAPVRASPRAVLRLGREDGQGRCSFWKRS